MAASVRERLRRAIGQAQAVLDMVEDGRECTELLDQLRACRAYLRSAEVLIVQEHAQTCMSGVDDEDLVREHVRVLRRFSRS
ncbi:MAG TPA: metal-sensing transcriptional repressor [Solirubrobacteraceae bacterium]|nr:metal-sensing transcriptional repressor [Solirubrobacteraceae bacterium]